MVVSNSFDLGGMFWSLVDRASEASGREILSSPASLLVWFFCGSGLDADSSPRGRANYSQALSVHLPGLLSGT